MQKYLYLIWKNLLRNRRRLVLTVLSMTISVFLIGSLVAVYAMLFDREVSEEAALRLVTRHKVSLTQALPYYYGSRIASIDGVEKIAPMNWFGGTYIDYSPQYMFARFAVDPEEIFNIYTELEIAPEQLEAFKRDRQGMAIGQTVAERAGLELGQRITIKGDIYPFDPEFTIRAIFTGPEDFQAFFHFKYLEEAIDEAQVGVFAVRLRSADDAGPVALAVDEMFRNAPEPTKTETEAAFQLAFVNQMGNIKLFLLSIGAAVLFTMLMVCANTIAMSVRERTREVGILKTLGFTSGTVLGLVLAEAVAISVLGAIAGIALTMAVTTAMADVMIQFFTGFRLPGWGVLVCFGTAAVVGLGSATIPAVVASRTNTVDALRHTG